jgi:hypothetical protein
MGEPELSSPSPEVDRLIEAASISSLSLDGLDEDDLQELAERVLLCDYSGVSEIAGIGARGSIRLVRSFHELEIKTPERRVLKSPDSRRLSKDILGLISENCLSNLSRNKVLSLLPALNPSLILERQERLSSALQIISSLPAEESKKLKEGLSSFVIEPPSAMGKGSGEPPVLRHFETRKNIVEAIFELLESCPGMASFFSENDIATLKEVKKILDGYSGGGIEDAEAIISDSELIINESFRKLRPDPEGAKRIVEEQIDLISNSLRLNREEEEILRRSALEGLSIPFEFERSSMRNLVRRWRSRKEQERKGYLSGVASQLARYRRDLEKIIGKALFLDFAFAVFQLSARYKLMFPKIGRDGISFIDGRNPFLIQASGEPSSVKPVSYSIGKTTLPVNAKKRNVVMLTGANSGGKTTLLTTVASIHIMTLLGLPVPARDAEVAPMPIYLFRRRVTKRIGSLEHALGSLIPVFADRKRKLILMDEFEALTEPGAAGRILAGLVNAVAATSSILLLVTHLARETLPHVRLPIRVDGIEASGLSAKGELIVDRQPIFDHIGSSTPKLIIMKLAKRSKPKGKELFESLLSALGEDEELPVQAPIALPWLGSENERL